MRSQVYSSLILVRIFITFLKGDIIMKKNIFTRLTFIFALLALTAVGEETQLSLIDTKWKLAGYVDAVTNELEEPDYSIYASLYGFCPCPTRPDQDTKDWYTLEFSHIIYENGFERPFYYSGKYTPWGFTGDIIVDYALSTINFGRPFTIDGPGTPGGYRYEGALMNSQTFELTDTSLKIYYGSEKLEYLLFRPWEPAPSKVRESARSVSQPATGAASEPIIAAVVPPVPEIILSSSPTDLAAGPNPVPKSAGLVNFYRVGKQVKSSSLKIYNSAGRFVGKIAITDVKTGVVGVQGQSQSKRHVGSWPLKDSKGRPVSEGSYLVKGTIKTVDGKSEKVSLLISVSQSL
jgi:hypothetical protein